MSREFFAKAFELAGKDEPFVIALVVRAEKPTSAKPGDKAIITAQGVLHGWVGGSCAQPTVIKEAQKALADGQPRLIRLSATPDNQSSRDGLLELPMTCFSGGTLEIYLDPQRPQPRLMVIGSSPVAQALVRLSKVMNYHVIAVDPDAISPDSDGEADELITDLHRLADAITPSTYVVVASHGNYDEIALEQVLRTTPAYLALVASKTRSKAVLEYLAAQGATQPQLDALKYPAGLDIHAVLAEEIAVSIIAEIVQRRRSAEGIETTSVDVTVDDGPTTAIDPVCGMTVDIVGANHSFQYKQQTYYFCSEGCQARFAADPEKYLNQFAPSGEAIDPICGMTVDIATAKYMSEYEGHLYYFCSPGCKLSFDNTPEQYAVKTAS
jgi:xanthine dehydrogenase accessory factor